MVEKIKIIYHDTQSKIKLTASIFHLGLFGLMMAQFKFFLLGSFAQLESERNPITF